MFLNYEDNRHLNIHSILKMELIKDKEQYRWKFITSFVTTEYSYAFSTKEEAIVWFNTEVVPLISASIQIKIDNNVSTSIYNHNKICV